jgi:hypothetical protein
MSGIYISATGAHHSANPTAYPIRNPEGPPAFVCAWLAYAYAASGDLTRAQPATWSRPTPPTRSGSGD